MVAWGLIDVPPTRPWASANALVAVDLPAPFLIKSAPVFNLEPAPGEPARFGFIVETAPIILKTAVPAGGGYGVEVSVEDISQVVSVLSSEVTLWGVPGDSRHDASRGWHDCLEAEATEPCQAESAPKGFLDLPTSCSQSLKTSVSGESWAAGDEQPAEQLTGNTEYEFPTLLTGCSLLEFNPQLTLAPEAQTASTPSGLDATVKMPQEGLTAGSGLAESALKETTVALPEGIELNPSAANALEACSAFDFSPPAGEGAFTGAEEERQTGNEKFSPGPPDCPDAAKVGTVNIKTPLLENEVTGSLYLAAQNTNPFHSPLALYLVAEDPKDGILVKLAGEVTVNEGSGQITTTFKNTPQLPFSELKLHIFGSQRASLSTPALCGSYQAQSTFTPWSGNAAAHPAAGLTISSGPGGGACPPSPLPFSPSFRAGSASPQAGAFSPLVVQLGRPDGQQQLSGLSIQLPPGDAAELAHAAPCPEPAAGGEWSCGPESLLGHATVSAGVGSEPVTLTGQVFLTAGYDGAPFGVLVRTHAAVGPFDLGYVNVRSKITVNPYTAVATITASPGTIPTRLDGVPVQLKALEVVTDRPEFTFTPTNCAAMAVTGTLDGSEGAADPVSYPFGVSNCSALPFKPAFTTSVKGQASKADGASFAVKVTSAGLGQANIAKTTVTLPKQLPSRLTTIQKACLAKVFEANPASCDEGSLVGSATIRTPIFKNPLSGPAYLVSHGNAAFPDLEFVLKGEGLEIILDGRTDIKKGVTTATFQNVPDAPFTSFETDFPAGPHSALTANVAEKKHYDLCGEKLVMPTTITGQNGAVVEQQTQIAILGCPKAKPKPSKLAKAITACRQRHKHAKAARVSCERVARRKYGAKSTKSSRHKPGMAGHEQKG